jgi:hypothetical protein
MGMLKWAAPLDLPKSYAVILKALYSNIIKTKMAAMQTEEVVLYRTRFASRKAEFDLYPFDSVSYKQNEVIEDKEQTVKVATSVKAIDLMKIVQTQQEAPKISGKSTILSFEVDFFGEVSLRAIKFYL